MLAMLSGFTPAAFAQSATYTPPPVGLTVSLVYEDLHFNDFSRVEDTIVANGEDFAVHQSTFYDGMFSLSPSDTSYYVEFSGFLVSSCEEDMPDVAARLLAENAFPIQVGDVVNIDVNGTNWRYTGLEKREHSLLNGETHEVIVVRGEEIGVDDPYIEEIALSTRWNSYLEALYGDYGKETATTAWLPSSAYGMPDPNSLNLSKCAVLLDR